MAYTLAELNAKLDAEEAKYRKHHQPEIKAVAKAMAAYRDTRFSFSETRAAMLALEAFRAMHAR